MRVYRRVFCLMVVLFLFCNIQAQSVKPNKNYSFKKGESNGIGKWYMDREIAHIMGFQGIDWLERTEREEEENASKLLRNMSIKSDDRIADIGAGSGYHVFKMAPLADNGLVYAVDIQEEMLAVIKARKRTSKFQNIALVNGNEKSIKLPENSVDKMLLVDVYHEFSFPVEMIASIKKALRPNGKMYLIEYRGEDAWVPIKTIHKMTEKQAVKEMKAAGFNLEQNISNLPWQHCMIFVKDKE